MGDFDFQALRDAQSVFGPLYFLVYIFFVFFVLINMFIAIINDTYLEVKSNLLNQRSEFQMKSFFKKVRNRLCAIINYLKVVNNRMLTGSANLVRLVSV